MFLASQNFQEGEWVTELSVDVLKPTLLMWLWWVMIPLEDFTDEDGDEDEDD